MSRLGLNGTTGPSGSLVNSSRSWYSTGEPISSSSYVSVPTFSARACSSFRTPGFHTLKKSQLPVQNFTSSFSVTNVIPGFSYTVTPYVGSVSILELYSGDMTVRGRFFELNYMLNRSFPDQASALAVNSLLKNIGNLKFNAAVALAESRQTAKLLTTTINRLANFVVALRRGNLAAAERIVNARSRLLHRSVSGSRRKTVSEFDGRVLKNARRELFGEGYGNRTLGSFKGPLDYNTFPRVFLEYQYGWRPLLQDIYGAAELLAQQAMKNRPVIATGTANDNNIFDDVERSSQYNYLTTTQTKGNARTRSKAVAKFAINDKCLSMMQSTGLSNPALVAWELMPYSFVVDWLWPIGSYLENLSASQGLTFAGGFQTTVQDYDLTASVSQSFRNGYSGYAYGALNQKGASIRRGRLDSFPVPNFPSIKNPFDLNLKQVAVSLALISQAFNRKG